MPERSYVRLTFDQQRLLCEAAQQTRLSPRELTLWAMDNFKLRQEPSERTIKRILQRHGTLAALPEEHRQCKKRVNPSIAAFDDRLKIAVDGMEEATGTVSGRHIVRLAKSIADEMGTPPTQRPRFSNGWLYRFQKRTGIQLKTKHGEAASVDLEAARLGREGMRKLTDLYALSNIYNMNETSLYYRQELKKTLSRKKKVSGRKLSKNRLTLCLAVNADGSDKLPPLLIGTAKTPHDLRGHDVSKELGLTYTNSPKAWVNSGIFQRWLLDLNKRMKSKYRKILLLVDNVSSRVRPTDELSHVRLEFLPKNTTSLLQPLDQGIICCTKRRFYDIKADYSFEQYRRNLPQEKVGVLRALTWIMEAWCQIRPEVIKNCWLHSGIVGDRPKISGLLNELNPMSIADLLY